MTKELKKQLILEIVKCDDVDLLDLIYKLLLTEKKEEKRWQ